MLVQPTCVLENKNKDMPASPSIPPCEISNIILKEILAYDTD
jgi:hypothetical protein